MTICKHVNDNGERCRIRAYFNINGEKEGLYCVAHKREEMIDVIHKTCIEKDCKTQAVFNYKGNKAGIRCSKHKEEGMIDIKNKTCDTVGCISRANFNYEGMKYSRKCSKHKEEGMIDIKNKTCDTVGCGIVPVFNYKGNKAGIRCTKHKEEGMIDVKHKRCITPLCDTIPSKEGYCSRCFYFTFPDKPQERNYKSKEILVTNYIKDNFKDYKVTFDQIISQGCSRRRPDIFIELYTHCIIVEVDEDQHLGYDSICENKRIVELYQDLGYRNIVYIRFNPDKYKVKDENGKVKTIRSCFSKDKDGKIKIGSSKDWNHRLEKLKDCITKNIENIPFKSISYEYLFYDETN